MSDSAEAGMLNRVNALFEVVGKLPDTISDEEIAGLMSLLPKDSRNSLSALFIPRLREGSLAFVKMISSWLEEARCASEEGKKTILVPFCFPPEIIQAFDSALPVTS